MIPLSHALSLSIILFVLGLLGIIIRRNLLFMLLGLEIIINAAALAFVAIGSYWNQEDGQIMYMLIITLASSESAIALILLLKLYKYYYTLRTNVINEINR